MRSRPRRTLGFQFAIAATAFSFYATAAQAQDVAYAGAQYTAEELDNLLAPVALYPDPILAQVLVAASYPEEIEFAAYHLSAPGESGIDDQPWDTSVRAVAHYPPVLNLMADRIDWTTALGQAYAEQPNDVMAAVQSLRSMARAHGNLVSTQQHQVVVEDRYIRILPAQPRAVYVPVYDPIAVYHRPVVHLGVYRSGWSFGVGFPIGVWLTYDFDWRRRHVYYHGWDRYYRRGWIQRSRPYIVINNIYVHSRPKVVVANRGVFRRRVDYRRFDRYNSVHRNVTWERHRRADSRRYATSGPSWDRNGRNGRSNIGTRNPSWDRSGRMRSNDDARRAVPRNTATPRQGRTNNGPRAESRQQTRRAPSWDRSGRNGQTDRATRSPSWDRSGQTRANNAGNRRGVGRSTAAPQSGRTEPQRAQPQRASPQRTQPRAQPQRAQPRGQSQRSQPRAQPQRTSPQRTSPARGRGRSQRTSSQRAQPQRQSSQRTEPRAQPQRTSSRRTEPRAQPQRSGSQGRSSSRAQSSPTRGQSSSSARSAPAQKERASSPGRSNRGNGGKSGSKGRGGRSK